MRYPALSEKQLSRFSYHPFWGLSIDKENTRNLYQEADDLDFWKSGFRRDNIQADIEWINQLPVILVMLCWMFNINNYRVKCYQLYSHLSLITYQAKITKLSQTERKSIEKVGGMIVSEIDDNRFGAYIKESFNEKNLGFVFERQAKWFFNRLKPYLPDDMIVYEEEEADIESNPSQNDSSSHTYMQRTMHAASHNTSREQIEKSEEASDQNLLPIRIMEDMVSALRVLGISRAAGQTFTLGELKKAYKKLALKTHPDRTNDTQVSFVVVANAYQEILEKIQSESEQQSNLTPEFAATLAKLDEQIEELRAKILELKHEKQAFVKLVDDYIKKYSDACISRPYLNNLYFSYSEDYYINYGDNEIKWAERHIKNIKNYIEKIYRTNYYYYDNFLVNYYAVDISRDISSIDSSCDRIKGFQSRVSARTTWLTKHASDTTMIDDELPLLPEEQEDIATQFHPSMTFFSSAVEISDEDASHVAEINLNAHPSEEKQQGLSCS